MSFPVLSFSVKRLQELLVQCGDSSTVRICVGPEYNAEGLAVFDAKGDCERVIHVPIDEVE